MNARAAATITKITASTTDRGGPLVSSSPKKIRSLPDRLISTGKKRTKATSRARASGAYGKRFVFLSARRNPMPMPRKLPRRTKFEKYERWRTLDPAHRISASSTKSMRKLRRTRRIRGGGHSLPAGSGAAAVGRSSPVISAIDGHAPGSRAGAGRATARGVRDLHGGDKVVHRSGTPVSAER